MPPFAKLIAAAAIIGSAAAPAAAQYQYPAPAPQPYPQPGYGYPAQPYGSDQSVVGAIVDGLIGNRYDVSYRQAIRQCAWAAVQRAQGQYGGDRYGQPYPGYNNVLRVLSIDDVERRTLVLRVRGTLGRGRYGGDWRDRNQPYDPRYNDRGGYGRAEFSFRCDVDKSNGYVRRVRLDPILYREAP